MDQKKPRIVILSAFLTPFRSGAEACAEEISQRLTGEFDVVIVTSKLRWSLPRKTMLEGKVPVVRVGIGCPIDKWLFPFFAPFAAKKLKPVLVHAILESFAGAALIICKWIMPDARRMLTLQTTNSQFLRKKMIRCANAVTAISSILAEQAEPYFGGNIRLIRNGIPFHELRRAAASMHKMPGRVLFVGRLEPMKGVDTLLRAFASLSTDLAHACLHIVGEGSQMHTLKTLAANLHVEKHVRFLGYVRGPELLREYAEAEVFCGLSRSEALGNVFLEAQAAGCAVIATRVGGIPDIVHDEHTGLLVPPDDPASAASAIALLLRDSALRQSLAESGAQSVMQFNWDTIAALYGEEYRKMVH